MMGQYRVAQDGRAGEGRVSAGVVATGRGSAEREPFRRSYIDRDGLAWEVREVAGADVPGSRGASCLVFESAVVIRRVWNVPANWRHLSAEELADLSWGK